MLARYVRSEIRTVQFSSASAFCQCIDATQNRSPVPQHNIVFHVCVFGMILGGTSDSGGNNIQDWKPETQLGPFIIAHELGHCRDYELHRGASIEPLKFPSGFDLNLVHKYYFDILITEIGACIQADRFYSKELLLHLYDNDCESFQNHKLEFESAKSQDRSDRIYHVACISSALIWLYLIQISKIIVGKIGTAFESEKLNRPFAAIGRAQV